MNEPMALATAFLAGAALGSFFFVGLWWTVQRGLVAEWPAAWFLSSLLIRSGVTVYGFYLVSQRDWHRLLACVLGFLIARTLVTRVSERVRT